MSLWLALVLIWFAAVVGFIWGAHLTAAKLEERHLADLHELEQRANEQRRQLTILRDGIQADLL